MKITYVNPRKNYKPSEGDIKTLKDGTRFVRRQVRIYDWTGKCLGREVAHGRPCFEWVSEPKPQEVDHDPR